MVSGFSTLLGLTQDCRVLIHFANDSGAFLETNLLPTLGKKGRSKTQGWNLGSLSRGGVVTPDSKAPPPARQLFPAQAVASSRSDLLLRNLSSIMHRYRTHHSTFH